MCDIDVGADVDFGTDSDIGDSLADSFDVADDIETSDFDSMSDVEGVYEAPETVESMPDMEESYESSDFDGIEVYPELSEFEDIDDQPDLAEDLEDVGNQIESVEFQDEMIESNDTLSLAELDDVEPELTFTHEELQELNEECAEDPEFGDKMEELISSGRVSISEMDDIDESDEDGVKVLTREITPEILESRERDTEEVLDNYRENLQERGASEEQIEEFIDHERESINAEYESLDDGKTSEYIYQMPTDWDAVADNLDGIDDEVSVDDIAENQEFQSENVEIHEETMDSEDMPEENYQNSEGEKSLDVYPINTDLSEENEEEYLGDLQQQLTEVYGIPEDSPELEAVMQNERLGWEEIHGNDLTEDIQESLQEMDSVDELSNGIVSDENTQEISESTPLSDLDDISADEIDTITEGVDSSEIEETSPSFEDTNVDGSDEGVEENISEVTEEDSILNSDSSIINDGLSESTVVSGNINEISEDAEQVEEEPDVVEELPDIVDDMPINVNETQEIEINYDEIYEGISQESLERGFEDVDIYEDAERLDASLENFETSNWENLSIDDQKESMNSLAEYVEEIIGFDNPPGIEYYNNPREGDYGGYNSRTNTLSINEYMLYNNSEAADTVAHELWHAHQHECADHPLSARDYQYQYNFENYIRPEMGHEAYENQLIEAEARAFAAQFKGRLAEIDSRRS